MRSFLALAFGAATWGAVALALYWNLRGERALPSNDHARLAALAWPLLLPAALGWLALRVARFLYREAVVETAAAAGRVVDTYRHGTLLPRAASPGNDLRPPPDPIDAAAAREVDELLGDAHPPLPSDMFTRNYFSPARKE